MRHGFVPLICSSALVYLYSITVEQQCT